jgi:predicted P-loop ATPase
VLPVEGHPCLVITEGFFKAIAGCSNGIPTIGLLGVEMGLTSGKADIQGKRYLVERLEKFARAEFGFIIAFDADAVANKAVIWAQLKLAQQLLKFKVPVYSATGNWSIEQGKGMDDYIQNHGADQFKREILGKALAPEEWVKIVSKLETDLASDQKPAKSRYMQRKNAIRALWGHRLRLNTLKQQVELDGEPLDIDFVRADLCEALDIDIPKEEAIEMVLTLAGVNRYCPITEYLRHVEQTYSDPNINLDTLASQLLNTSNPLHAVYLKRHLIGSVARALHPGCKMDTALILQGNQGILKSTFFNILYGDGFFDDTMTETGDKDEIMKLHQHWAVEWAEFETTLSRRGYSRLKAFMTTKVDNFRPPYGRTVKSCLRHSVLVGSTNEPEFLNDPSGDRRFWVIPIKQINIELTKSLRDQIWAAAVQAYKKGEPWHLNEQEKQWADEANRPFRVSDTWEDFISNYIQGKQFVTIAEVLSHGLDLEPAKQDKSSQMRATAILRRWGWAKGKRWAMNSWQRGWFAPDDRSTDPPFLEVDREVDRSDKPNEIKGSSYTDPPDPPFPPTLSEITTSTQHQLTPTPGEGENDVKENSGKSWEKGGSVMEVDRSESDVKSRVTTTDPPTIHLPIHLWITAVTPI